MKTRDIQFCYIVQAPTPIYVIGPNEFNDEVLSKHELPQEDQLAKNRI